MGPSRHTPTFTAQRGQALPLGLAFIAGATLLTLVVFNTGKISAEKSQVVNTADAAVYSGLVWQARSLNFQAYTNRAMVANQVSIAQMVSLGSWTNYGRISARNLDYAIGWIPIVAPFTSALVQAMEMIEDVVQQAIEVAIPIIDGTNTVLSVVQEAVYNASYVATPEVVNTIVKANDSRFRASSTYSIAAAAQNAKAWQSLSQRYSDDDEAMTRKTEVIRESRDDFSANRGWDKVQGLPSKVTVTPVDRFAIIKEGTTDLMQDGADWEWRGKDGLSVHWEHYSCGTSGCDWENLEIPMGWGSNYAEGDGACSGNACSNWFQTNGTAELMADAENVDISGYSGVKAYRSLKDLSSDNRDPRLQLHVEVEVEENDVRTAEKISKLGSAKPTAGGMKQGLEPGLFYTEDDYAKESIASISSGEVFFERPVLESSDNLSVNGQPVTEYANLFNPYWDVRLINVSNTERQKAWALRSPELAAAAAQDAVVTAASDAATDAATDFATDTATDAISENTNIDQAELENYAAMGEDAINVLKSDAITDAIKDAVKGALTSAVKNGLSSYAESNGFGDAFNTASTVLEDGEINIDDLGAITEGTALGDAVDVADGLLDGAEDLASTLISTAGVEDAVSRITDGLEGEAAALGEGISESFTEIFAAELDVGDQLVELQNTFDSVQSDIGAQAEDITNTLRDEAANTLDLELASLEESLGSSLEDLGIDKDTVVADFNSAIDTTAEGVTNEATEALSGQLDELQTQFGEEFGSLAVNPETVADGALTDAEEFISQQAAGLQSNIDQALGDVTQQNADVVTNELQATLDRIRHQAQQAINERDNPATADAETALPRFRESN